MGPKTDEQVRRMNELIQLRAIEMWVLVKVRALGARRESWP